MSVTASKREQQVHKNMERVYNSLGGKAEYLPSTLARMTGLSVDKVRTALGHLANEGWVVRGTSGWRRAVTPVMQHLLYGPPPLGRQLDAEHFLRRNPQPERTTDKT